MKCYFHFDEKSGNKILIPYCWSVLWSNDISECTCEKFTTVADFEKKIYNEELTEKNREILELQKEIKRLNSRVEFWQKKSQKNG